MVSIGAQWAVLQSAAWIGMAVSYSIKAGSVSEGLSQTFDGAHPCKLCCMVKKGTESEKKDTKQNPSKQKQELFASSEIIILAAPITEDTPRADQASAIARSMRPPHQPPRCA